MEGAMVSLVSVGQDTGLRRFFGNPMGGIIGAVASVVSLVLGIVFYLQSQRYPELVYLARPVPVVLAQPGGALQVQFKGQTLASDVVALQIALGNQGRAPIRKEHILEPLEIRIQPPVSALEAKVTKQSRDVVRLQAEDAAELYRHGRVPLTFSILEQGDDGTIQIIYTGVRNIAPQVTGTIEGQSSLRNLGAKPKSPLSPQDDHPIRILLTINRLASVCDV